MESKLTNWSVENATKAYLKTLKMGIKRPSEPDVSEYISAVAAGNDAQLMVVVCGGDTNPTTLLALVAAAHQTGGRVVCIFPGLEELQLTKQALSEDTANSIIEFVVGDAERLILEYYKEVDLLLNDCKIKNYEAILRVVQSTGKKCKESIVLGCNAFCSSSWDWAGVRTQLLPIGEGLLVTKIAASKERERGRGGIGGGGGGVGVVVGGGGGGGGGRRKSHWVVKVDQQTGEEHVFRVRCPSNGQGIE